MLSTLVDNATLVYVLLIIICAGLLFAWRRTRKWGYLAGTAAGFVLVDCLRDPDAALYYRLEKDGDMIRATADAVEHRDVDTIQRNLARDFRYHSADRKVFIEKTRDAIQRGDATKVDVWDFNLESMDKEKGVAVLLSWPSRMATGQRVFTIAWSATWFAKATANGAFSPLRSSNPLSIRKTSKLFPAFESPATKASLPRQWGEVAANSPIGINLRVN